MAKYKNRTVKLNKPFRTPGKSKKFGVYVKNRSTGRVQIVRFGDPSMKIKKNIPSRQRSFMARHGAILKKVRGQKSLAPVFWAIKSWRKGFNI
jgi:hypothetical protein|tara:strand:+ start:1145 stop:1423 length:279 start_codon:yes stop_codon:yes gene_type:complete